MRLQVASTVMVWLFACTLASSSDQFPCDHPLRHFPIFSDYFTHCECSRSEWTEWATIGTTNASSCSSGRAVIEERKQTVFTGDCDEIVERNATCEPTNEEKLILALGLGSTGQHINPTGCSRLFPFEIRERRSLNETSSGDSGIGFGWPDSIYTGVIPQSYSSPDAISPACRRKRSTCDKRQVCSGFGRRRRRVRSKMKLSQIHINTHSSNDDLEPEPDNPIPFDVLKHGHRYRREGYDRECRESQYILFVLDTSGSISDNAFERMTTALGCLVPLFCNPIKVAVMTFTDNFYMEFSFDCYGNTCQDRKDAAAAIGAITHRSGPRTLTGGAVRCVDELITNRQIANFSIDEDTRCLDVVFITDGRSNGPLDVCHEISESYLLSNKKIKVHAIGIDDNVNKNEIACLSGNSTNGLTLFFPGFDNFITALNGIVYDLTNRRLSSGSDIDQFVCINSDIYPVIERLSNQPCIADACNEIR